MSLNGSFSSSDSTLTYHSASQTSSNTRRHPSTVSQSSSTSTGVFPLYQGESLSTSVLDFELDDRVEILMDELWQCQSGLYDISLKISMDLPKDETFNRPDMLRASIYTICGDVFFKHEEWRSIGSSIAHQLGRAVNPISSIWFSTTDKRLLYRGETRITGHTRALTGYLNLPIVHNTITFSDFICATTVRLEYSVDVFLSPGVTGAGKIYKIHGFPSDPDTENYKTKYMADILMSHKEEGLEVYDHHLAWATVYNVLEEYRNNVEKQNKFFEEYGLSF